MKTHSSEIFLKAKFGEILNTKIAPKIMLINSKPFRVIAQQKILPLLARNCNTLGLKHVFHNLINSNLYCMR
jgi:hypothetical protein